MRYLLVVLLIACGLAFASPSDRLVLIPGPVPILETDVGPAELLYAENGVSLLSLSPDRLEEWTHRVHRLLKGCGGFIDVTEDVERGLNPFELVENTHKALRHPSRASFRRVAFRQEVADLVAHADADKYWKFLTELTTQFENRSARTAKGVEASQFIQQRALNYSAHLVGSRLWTVETQSSYLMDQPSVVLTLEGSDPSLPAVVIGGHMDTISPSSVQPGADDDGSGTSVVMEALRAVANANARFRHTIHFMWYAAEEHGLVGSKNVVNYFKNNNLSVKAAIQFDMVGQKSAKDDKDIYMINDYTNPALTTLVKDLIKTYTKATIGDTKCGYPCSDHVNWHLSKIPAAFPFEAAFSNMNGKIHTQNDTMSLLNKEHAFYFVQLALAYLGEVADLVVSPKV